MIHENKYNTVSQASHQPLHDNILVDDVFLKLKWVDVQQIDVTSLSAKVQTIGLHG